ncbi:MAG: hypothetical protein K2H88_03120 [Duncaniella sp.]|nr:hypothetical protein [Duncaniella sp.]MDE6465195.1 hypothetical protein [Duncaniella sp.]
MNHNFTRSTLSRLSLLPLIVTLSILLSATISAQRRVTPVTPPSPGTAAKVEKEERIDPSRLVTTIDANGNSVTVDTVTGREYVDSTLLKAPPKMEYPRFYNVIAGVNIWDPVMRLLGQKHGVADVWAELNMHNRYFPFIGVGLGTCNDTPEQQNYTFKAPLAPFFKIGCSYNFFYNSNPDYKLQMGLRYGFTRFKWQLTDVTVDEGYWQDPTHYSLPLQNTTAGYLEVAFGLKVRIAGPLSMGWSIVYHSMLHESASPHGKPMYIPGFGKRSGALSANFSIMYTFAINKKTPLEVEQEKDL